MPMGLEPAVRVDELKADCDSKRGRDGDCSRNSLKRLADVMARNSERHEKYVREKREASIGLALHVNLQISDEVREMLV